MRRKGKPERHRVFAAMYVTLVVCFVATAFHFADEISLPLGRTVSGRTVWSSSAAIFVAFLSTFHTLYMIWRHFRLDATGRRATRIHWLRLIGSILMSTYFDALAVLQFYFIHNGHDGSRGVLYDAEVRLLQNLLPVFSVICNMLIVGTSLKRTRYLRTFACIAASLLATVTVVVLAING